MLFEHRHNPRDDHDARGKNGQRVKQPAQDFPLFAQQQEIEMTAAAHAFLQKELCAGVQQHPQKD